MTGSSSYIIHTTTEGERWDQISTKNYGSPGLAGYIIRANPGIPIYDQLPGGIDLLIPIVATTDVKINTELLPPWKQ